MRRWRTVGLLNVPTDDGRMIESVAFRPLPLPILKSRRGPGHIGARPVGRCGGTRLQGDEIRLLLPWRHRRARLDLVDVRVDVRADGLIVMRGVVAGATISGGPNAWGNLP